MLVVACPDYNNGIGRLDVYIIEVDNSLSFLYWVEGNITEKKVGISLYVFEYDSNHYGIFY